MSGNFDKFIGTKSGYKDEKVKYHSFISKYLETKLCTSENLEFVTYLFG